METKFKKGNSVKVIAKEFKDQAPNVYTVDKVTDDNNKNIYRLLDNSKVLKVNGNVWALEDWLAKA